MPPAPTLNSFAVVDIATGNQLMHVVDAANPNDPAFNPPGSVHIPIAVNQYASADYAALDAAIIATGLSQGVVVKSIIPPIAIAVNGPVAEL